MRVGNGRTTGRYTFPLSSPAVTARKLSIALELYSALIHDGAKKLGWTTCLQLLFAAKLAGYRILTTGVLGRCISLLRIQSSLQHLVRGKNQECRQRGCERKRTWGIKFVIRGQCSCPETRWGRDRDLYSHVTRNERWRVASPRAIRPPDSPLVTCSCYRLWNAKLHFPFIPIIRTIHHEYYVSPMRMK